jgi:uncharacterized protein (DUF433 family)
MTMSIIIHHDPAPLRVDSHGDVRIGNTRVLLDLVIHAFDNGASPETIVEQYPTLSLNDVYATLTYYLNHRDDVREYLRLREEQAAEVQKKIEAEQESGKAIRERLLKRRTAQEVQHAPSGDR